MREEKGYTQSEAEAMVDQLMETRITLSGVPSHTRGRVIGTVDAGDHWNIVIEWELPRLSARDWYDKFDVQSSMRQAAPDPGTFPET